VNWLWECEEWGWGSILRIPSRVQCFIEKKEIKKKWTGFCSERHTVGPLTLGARLSYSKDNYFKPVNSDYFLYRSTLIYLPNSCTFLISTNVKWASPAFITPSGMPVLKNQKLLWTCYLQVPWSVAASSVILIVCDW